MSPPDPTRRWWARARASESLHTFGLWALALAQPVYQLIAANPQFLAAHGAGRREVAILVVALSLLLPALLVALELSTAVLGARVRSLVHSGVVAILIATFLIQIAKRALPNGAWALAVSVLAAIAFAVAYHRVAALRTFATFLSAAALVVPLTFLFHWRILAILGAKAEVDTISARAGKPLPLVVVLLDELPLAALLDDHFQIDGALFPNFARVASWSHWFRNATTSASHTDIAVPALHTGCYVNKAEWVPATLENYPGNLFTLLDSTHHLQVLETSTCLLPRCSEGTGAGMSALGRSWVLLEDVAAVALHVVTPPPWDSRLPPLDVAWAGFWDDVAPAGGGRHGRITEVEDFLGHLSQAPRPPFVYLHPRFPHMSWEYLPSGRRYRDPQFVPGLQMIDTWSGDDWLTEQAYQRLMLQLQATDRLLGEVLARLEQLHWLDDAVLVVTADHGAAFTPGLARRNVPPDHPDTLLAEIMPIPLFLKLPGQTESVVHDQPVEIIDVLPTLAQLLELEVPWPMDGRSLLAGEGGEGGERPPRRLQLKEPYVTVSFDRARAAPLESLARGRRAWFGSTPEGHLDLTRLGPNADLIGLTVPAAAEREPAYTAVVLGSELFNDVQPDSELLPVFVRGEIHARSATRPRAPLPIAISVNGTVQATTRTYDKPYGGIGFAALLPEAALVPGRNDLGIYLIDDARQLREIESGGLRDSLRGKFERSHQVLFAADGRSGWTELRTTYADTRVEASGGLAIAATADVPVIELPTFDPAGFDDVVIAVDLEPAQEARVRIFYATEDQPSFQGLRFVAARVREGRGVYYFELRAPRLLGRLKLDLVAAGAWRGRPLEPPRVVLHSFEARGVD